MGRLLTIDGIQIADNSDCYVIAEIGHNHGGSVDTCKQLFDAARDAGCNAVKLQKRDNRSLYSDTFYNSPYVNENSYGATYGEHREALEFDWDEYCELQGYALILGLTFFATAFDVKSLEFLAQLGVPAIKIASGDLTSWPLIEAAARYGKPVVLSTGGGYLKEVRKAHKRLEGVPHAILQCTSGYPAKYDELNLKVIETYRREFPEQVIGWSAHDTGIAMASVAYALGARIVEKHFTLNRASKGTDHAMSLEPQGMKTMIENLHITKQALGNGVKYRYESENEPLKKQEKKLIDGEWRVDGNGKFADARMERGKFKIGVAA